MKRRLILVAGLLMVLWGVSVVGLGVATFGSGVGVDINLTVPVVLAISAMAVVVIGYYVVSKGSSHGGAAR